MSRRSEVLRVLKASPEPMTIVAIAETIGVHPNTVRFHLDSMLESGQVERATAERRTPGRPPLLFVAARGMDQEGPRDYRALAELLALGFAEDGDRHERALAAGRSWVEQRVDAEPAGSSTPPVDRLVGLLDELSFAPVVLPEDSGATLRIGMRHCPYLEIANESSDIVCTAHLGLMQGALDAWGADVTVERVESFAEPDLCIARLRGRRKRRR